MFGLSNSGGSLPAKCCTYSVNSANKARPNRAFCFLGKKTSKIGFAREYFDLIVLKPRFFLKVTGVLDPFIGVLHGFPSHY